MPRLGGNRHHIQGSMGLLLAQFWYIMDPKMVLDSVTYNNISFSENHAFYCCFVHEGSLNINMQSSPYWSYSNQLGLRPLVLPHWKLLSFYATSALNFRFTCPEMYLDIILRTHERNSHKTWCADVVWLLSEMIKFWLWFVDFPNFGPISTPWPQGQRGIVATWVRPSIRPPSYGLVCMILWEICSIVFILI